MSENEPGLLRSSVPFAVTGRTSLFAGFIWSVCESVAETLAPYPCLLANARLRWSVALLIRVGYFILTTIQA